MPKVLIPDKVARGLLPTLKPLKVFAGLGNSRPCDGCGRSIAPTEVEFEFDFANGPTVRLHKDCSAIWHAATGN